MKFFENVEEYMKNSNMTREEKTAFIKAVAELYEQQVDKEYRRNIRDYRLGAALEIGSAAIPGVAGTKMALKIAPKVIQKTIGRKLVNDTLSGAINSGLSGGVYGFGEGLAENKNPFTNSAQKATEGLIAGGLTSHMIGNINKTSLGNKLQTYGNIDNLSDNVRKSYNQDTRKYYQDYIQSRAINRDGNIDFTRAGVQETLRWNPHQGQNFPYLIDDIKKAKRLPD